MEEKYWQQKWWEAGFKTEDEWLDWWVSVLEKSISETQDKLNHLRKEPWESEPQLANFIQCLCEYTDSDHDHCAIARVIRLSAAQNPKKDVSNDILVLELRGYNGKFYKRSNVKDFLLSYIASGKKWYEIARETSARIVEILNIAEKIRRNTLYPEVVEMERNIMCLESRKIRLEALLEEAYGFHDKAKSQLAEKEKEIGELKTHLEKITKDFVGKLIRWRGKLDSICSQLINTKSIFKSKRIADIRDQVHKLNYEVWEEYGQLDK